MTNRNRPIIIVLDPRKLRQAGLVRLLQDWADCNTFQITAISSCKDINLDQDINIIVINIGGLSVLDRAPRSWLRSIRSFIPNIPIVILSDREDRGEVCAAFSEGARGFIPTSLEPSIALDALMFIHRGGSFFPSWALTEEARRTREPLPDSNVAKRGEAAGLKDTSGVVPSPEWTDAHLKSVSFRTVAWSRSQHAGSRTPANAEIEGELQHPETHRSRGEEAADTDICRKLRLTPRQREVLKGLGEGKPNKVIARELDMTESTVKVHVRQIMRKFGAENRTQVALIAIQFSQGN